MKGSALADLEWHLFVKERKLIELWRYIVHNQLY
jgi:hypothetical protein